MWLNQQQKIRNHFFVRQIKCFLFLSSLKDRSRHAHTLQITFPQFGCGGLWLTALTSCVFVSMGVTAAVDRYTCMSSFHQILAYQPFITAVPFLPYGDYAFFEFFQHQCFSSFATFSGSFAPVFFPFSFISCFVFPRLSTTFSAMC